MPLKVSPQTEARLFDVARREGIDPSELIEKMVQEYRPSTEPHKTKKEQSKFTAENDPLMARLEARIAQAPTDPGAIEEAEQDLREFMRSMNSARKEAGARLLYPEVE